MKYVIYAIVGIMVGTTVAYLVNRPPTETVQESR